MRCVKKYIYISKSIFCIQKGGEKGKKGIIGCEGMIGGMGGMGGMGGKELEFKNEIPVY